MRVRLNINGMQREVETPPGTSLLNVLRDDLDLTAARFGCGQGVCGACYVLIDGRAQAACTMSVEDVVGRTITTVEGLARDGKLHPVQQAFLDEDALQCGYCTSGMLISAVALLNQTPHPDEDEIRAALTPHLCRCSVYLRAIRAVQRAAR